MGIKSITLSAGMSFVPLFAPAYPRSRRFRNDGSASDCIMTKGSSAAGSSSGQRKSISPKAPSPAPIAYAIQINAKIATPSDFSIAGWASPRFRCQGCI